MKPSTVVISLACLLTFSGISYIYYFPDALLPGNRDRAGYWGAVDAEFNWCEYNYLLSHYIAEPWNTITGSTYIIIGIILYPYYYNLLTVKNNININHLLPILIILIAVGIGTCLYHATLRYKMQLLDEFPMYFLLCYGFTIMYLRCRGNTNLYNISLIFASMMCGMVWFSERYGFIHELGRIILVLTFGLFFVYIFYVGAAVSGQCKDKQCEKLFDKCYTIWIISIACWLIENIFCDALRTNTIIPYFNLHGTIWHLGSCLGIYYFFHVMLIYMMVEQYSIDVKVNTFALIFPYINVKQKK